MKKFCKICKEKIENAYRSQKYCKRCGRIAREEGRKAYLKDRQNKAWFKYYMRNYHYSYHHDKKEIFENLTEEQKSRIMTNLSLKYLTLPDHLIKNYVYAITEEEFLEILRHTKKPKLKTAFILAFYQGMTALEIVNLKKEDVDLANNLIRIEGNHHKVRIVRLAKEVIPLIDLLPIPYKHKSLNKAFRRCCYNTFKWSLSFKKLQISSLIYYLKKGMSKPELKEFVGKYRTEGEIQYLKTKTEIEKGLINKIYNEGLPIENKIKIKNQGILNH